MTWVPVVAATLGNIDACISKEMKDSDYRFIVLFILRI